MTVDATNLELMHAELLGGTHLTRAQRKARRHSRLVRFLRVFFPFLGALILAGMVALVVVFNYLADLGIGSVSLTGDGLVMYRPELSGHDGERSYKVTAERALQRLSNPKIIDLEMIRAEIIIDAEQNAKITSLKGTYDNGAEMLRLYGGLQLEWSQGYTIDLAEVTINLKSGALHSEEPLSIRSDKGDIQAGRLSYDQDAGIVRFSDGIRMTLQPAEQGKD